jgi:hypothetical protein
MDVVELVWLEELKELDVLDTDVHDVHEPRVSRSISALYIAKLDCPAPMYKPQ